jgi:ribosome biogenesis protein BMS1
LDKSDDENAEEEVAEDDEDNNLIEKAQRQFELQSERNKNEFGEEGELARQSYEGFRQGLYVRIHLKGVPVEFIKNFSSSRPIIVGGLLPSETSMGFITARVKRHRWHKRILKSNDPLIFSIGWRRFQVFL